MLQIPPMSFIMLFAESYIFWKKWPTHHGHGEEGWEKLECHNLISAPSLGHLFAECLETSTRQNKNTRQQSVLPSVWTKTLGKQHSNTWQIQNTRQTATWPRCVTTVRDRRQMFAECSPMTRRRLALCEWKHGRTMQLLHDYPWLGRSIARKHCHVRP